MRDSNDAIKAANKLINVDEIADFIKELDDILAENRESQNFFANVATVANDDLLAELEDELDDAMIIDFDAIIATNMEI